MAELAPVIALRPRGPEPFITKRQLATHLGMSERWIEYRVTEGMPHRRFGNRVRFRLSDVERWLEER